MAFLDLSRDCNVSSLPLSPGTVFSRNFPTNLAKFSGCPLRIIDGREQG
jgi:hypothetical protein